MLLETTRKLIGIPSTNPMGKPLDSLFESRMTEFLIEFLSQRQVEHEVLEVSPRRANVLAFLPGTTDHLLLADAHQDTVPVTNMTIDPFAATVENGRIAGRGACDVKGSLAVLLCLIDQLARQELKNRSQLLFSFTCDEEYGETGILDLAQSLATGGRGSTILRKLGRQPDLAIVCEPTDLHLVAAHKGTVRWKIETGGIAAHSSDPSQGQNAIYKMARLVKSLEQYASQLPMSREPHPLAGGPTLSVGRITGGTSVNIVPDCCSIEIDRRLAPGEQPLEAVASVEAFLKQDPDLEFRMLPPFTQAPPLSNEGNRELAEKVLGCLQHRFQEARILGVPFGTHAARLAAIGIPSLVFGPGSIQQAHTPDEWIEISQLEAAESIWQRIVQLDLETERYPA